MFSYDDTSDGSGELSYDDECSVTNCLNKKTNCQSSVEHNLSLLYKQTPGYLIISGDNDRNYYGHENEKINCDYLKSSECNDEWNEINLPNSNCKLISNCDQLQCEWSNYHRNNLNLTSHNKSKDHYKYYSTRHLCVQPSTKLSNRRYESDERLSGGGCKISPSENHELNFEHEKNLKLNSTPSKTSLKRCYCCEYIINYSSNESQSFSCNCTSTSQEYYPDKLYESTKHRIKCRKKRKHPNFISKLSSQSIINNDYPQNIINKATSNICREINLEFNDINGDTIYKNDIDNINAITKLNVSSSLDNCLINNCPGQLSTNINEDFIEHSEEDDGAVDVAVMCIEKKTDVYDLRSSSMADNINSVIITLLTIITFIILSAITWAIGIALYQRLKFTQQLCLRLHVCSFP